MARALATDSPVTKVPVYPDTVYPPWQHGASNHVADRGLEFTVPEVDNLPDFHGNPIDPKLVLYVEGNYVFALASSGRRSHQVCWSNRWTLAGQSPSAT